MPTLATARPVYQAPSAPKQSGFRFTSHAQKAARASKEVPKKIDAMRSKNLECAEIILQQPVRYAGLLLEWAKLTMERGDA